MTPEQIEAYRDKHQDMPRLQFWLSEIALQLAKVREGIGKLSGLVPLPVKPVRPVRVRIRRYYITEYVPTVPPKFDRVSCEKPTDGVWHHEITGTSKEDAARKMSAQLTKQREAAGSENAA